VKLHHKCNGRELEPGEVSRYRRDSKEAREVGKRDKREN